jgi:hypothetical protein
MIEGWYYLHVNGEMIYKRDYDGTVADIRDSDFARAVWPMDPSDRAGAWRICIEGLAAGANPDRIKELAAKWGCNDEDAMFYAKHIGVILEKDEADWRANRKDFINIQESNVGFGKTALEAFADLAKDLGYRPSKMWGAEFSQLVAGKA